MLRPHQVEPASRLIDILKTHQSAVDCSDMGVGKTAIAVAVAKELNLPTLIVCPHISQTGWKNMAELFGDKFSVINYEKLRTGNTPYGTWDNNPQGKRLHFYQCTNCQERFKPDAEISKCYCRPDGIHCFETKKVAHRYGRFNFHPGVQFVIFDEVQRCGGVGSLNAKMLVAAKRQGIKILGCSATLGFSPEDLWAIGYMLDLHNLVDFDSWLYKAGYSRIPGGSYLWMAGKQKQLAVMQDIRGRIFPARGVRVTKDSIPDFPECEIRAELYDLEKSGRLTELYAEMGEALAELEQKRSEDKSSEHPLTRILRASQEIELVKLPIMIELRDLYREKGFSVAMFLNFSQSIAELRKRIKCDCIIDGTEEGVVNRAQNIQSFQDNISRDIIVNIKAGGLSISLGDTRGDFPRAGLSMPCFSAEDFKQMTGRLPRHGGKSKSIYHILFAAGVEVEKLKHSRLSLKLNNLDALNDADVNPQNLRFRC